MSSKRRLAVEIHLLVPTPRRTWTLTGADGRQFQLHVTPMMKCRKCISHSTRGFTGCRLCGVVHCECCADASIALLAVDHTHGGGLLCAACIVSRSLKAKCAHPGAVGRHTVIEVPAPGEAKEQRPT